MVAMERPNPLNWGILTSMSIRNAVRRLVSEGRLIDHEPSVPAQRGKRRVYLSPTLQSLLDGPWQSKVDEKAWARVRQDLDHFVTDGLVSVARETYRSKDAHISRLVEGSEEVWELRCRASKPGIRVFGRFAVVNEIVLLTWELRLRLKDRDPFEWIWAKEYCKDAWTEILPCHQPLTGVEICDCISEKFISI